MQTSSSGSTASHDSCKSIQRFMRPMTSPVHSCCMGHGSPYGGCGLPPPPYHYPMMPIFYPHGPRARFSPHMPYPPPLMPAYPTCYPYQHTRRSGKSPKGPMSMYPSWHPYHCPMPAPMPQRWVFRNTLVDVILLTFLWSACTPYIGAACSVTCNKRVQTCTVEYTTRVSSLVHRHDFLKIIRA